MDHNIGGSLLAPSSYFMKSPPEQYPDDIARNKTEEFIKQYGKKSGKKAAVEEKAEA
jgi:myo-inositol-1-phosphate synthase